MILTHYLVAYPQEEPNRYSLSRTSVAQCYWAAIAERHSQGESLRQLAKTYGVSYEAIRRLIKQVERRSISCETEVME